MIKFLKIKNKKVSEMALTVLKKEGVLVMPTETAYGLVADAGSKKAIEKIYKIKGRSQSKFLPYIAGSLKQLKDFFELHEKEGQLVKKYPGLTLILRPLKYKNIKTLEHRKIFLWQGQKTCAVRISKYKLAREIALKLGRPITATSANVSGGENCYSGEEVVGQLKNKKSQIDLIIDGGKLKKRKPSTIVKVEGKKIEILRQGEIRVIC